MSAALATPEVDQRIATHRELAGRSGIPVNETVRWEFVHSRDGLSSIFLMTEPPPTYEPALSDRVLFVGTKMDGRYMAVLEDAIKSGGILPQLVPSFGKALTGSVGHSVSTASFWRAFFDSDHFCDEPVTKPRAILTTGRIRNYDMGGMTLDDMTPTLRAIADHYGIPLVPVAPEELERIARPLYELELAKIRSNATVPNRPQQSWLSAKLEEIRHWWKNL